jgi:hypothetical protein
MILNLLRVEELRVEDMMKRSFAELGKLACTIRTSYSNSGQLFIQMRTQVKLFFLEKFFSYGSFNKQFFRLS